MPGPAGLADHELAVEQDIPREHVRLSEAHRVLFIALAAERRRSKRESQALIAENQTSPLLNLAHVFAHLATQNLQLPRCDDYLA